MCFLQGGIKMRIGGLPPISPPGRTKEGQKSTVSPRLAPDKKDEFIKHAEGSSVSYPAYSPQVHQTDEAHLQMKNYVTTVLLRQNWVEKTSRLNAHVLRAGSDPEFINSSYWQPEQAAKRILSFAQTLGGEDPSRIDTLQASVLTGIEDTIKMLGGETPAARMTKEYVLNLFQDWRSRLSPGSPLEQA
jgi:hypothetical protein